MQSRRLCGGVVRAWGLPFWRWPQLRSTLTVRFLDNLMFLFFVDVGADSLLAPAGPAAPGGPFRIEPSAAAAARESRLRGRVQDERHRRRRLAIRRAVAQ